MTAHTRASEMKRKAPETALKGREIVLGILISVLLILPFLNKAFHIDDTVVLQVVANILTNPLDPLAGSVDWFGVSLPTWVVTTNPPFLSYYLAPFAWISNYSERVLHLAMIPFLAALTIGGVFLSKRFTRRSWLPVLFVVTSAGVWVSVNVMRDVPALGLTTVATALGVLGVDRDRSDLVAWGSILAGLAILTKYSAVIVLPVLLVYMIVQNRFKILAWFLPALVIFGLWCFQTWFLYGAVHPFYLLFGDHPGGGRGIWEKFFAFVVIIGSVHLLGLLALFEALLRKRPSCLLLYGGAGLGMVLASALVYPDSGIQYWFWTFVGAGISGCAFVSAFLKAKNERPWWIFRSADGCFLLAWFLAPALFSIFFAPFQAVRHVIPAVMPLSFLLFRFLDSGPGRYAKATAVLSVAVLALQAMLGLAVGLADEDYADCYRDFARYARQRWTSGDFDTWYVGHWGWKFYADQAGFRQFHGEGPVPDTGDILLWPRRVHIGEVFSRHRGFRDRLQEIDSIECTSRIPIRTMNSQGASFYAVLRDSMPFKFQLEPLETLRVYRVGPELRTEQ